MKNCPFCEEEIQEVAIKCKYCGGFLERSRNPPLNEEKFPWYFRSSFIVIVFLAVGPLTLSLILWWLGLSPAWNFGLTVAILMISWALYQVAMVSFHSINDYYQILKLL